MPPWIRENAQKWYSKVVDKSDDPIHKLHYAQALQSNGNNEKASLYYQKYADAILLTAAPAAPSVPGKISEYVSAKRPIIFIGDGPWRNRFPDIPSGAKAIAEASQAPLTVPNLGISTAKDAALFLSERLMEFKRIQA